MSTDDSESRPDMEKIGASSWRRRGNIVNLMEIAIGDHIALSETPTEMFKKIMRIPDFAKEEKNTTREIHNDSIYIDGQKSMILLYLELLTDTSQEDLLEINQSIKKSLKTKEVFNVFASAV